MKKWCVAECDKQLAKTLAEECDIDPITALIASSRGYTEPYEIEQFLSDEPVFDSPRVLADINKAASIINNEIKNGTHIAIYGDYDCDGITATSLLYRYLKYREADCIYYIPDRFSEGYGMNLNAVRYLKEQNVGLIITVDNGIASLKEIAYANELGIKTVVTDHHIPGEKLPDALAVVDPHRTDCNSEFKEICGAEVAFKLICVMEEREPEELLPYFADLLAVALTADIMPFTQENRFIVKQGIEKLKKDPLTGLSAIINVAGITKANITAGNIAFGIAPRINATGRMGNAALAVELLCCDDMLKALSIATEMDAMNTERQEIEKSIIAAAVNIIEENGYFYDRVIVVDGENWHKGIVGIAASKICERYGKPAVVISREGEIATGSGRSIEGFSLYSALEACKETLVKFGGHKLAAGMSLYSDNIENFRRIINEYADNNDLAVPELKLDCRLNPIALTIDLAEALNQLEPFGNANPAPVFGVYGVTLQKIIPIGGARHLRLVFAKDDLSFQALLFGMTPQKFCFKEGDLLDTAVTVETNLYNGELSLSIRIKALRMNGTDDGQLFSDIDNLNKFIKCKDFDGAPLLPSREQTGIIYKYIADAPVSEERIKYIFLNSIGYGKTAISLIVLEELGLIEKSTDGIYKSINPGKKTNLINSKTYKTLTEEVRVS